MKVSPIQKQNFFPAQNSQIDDKKTAKRHQILSGAPAVAKVCPSDRDVSDDGQRVETRPEGHAESD